MPGTMGFGYPFTAVRVEYRPTRAGLHSRDELLKVLDGLQAAGADAWWYSAEASGSLPLFPSKYLPYVKGQDAELLPWLVREAHKRGIALISWAYLNAAELVAQEHPEWKVRYLDGDERLSPRDERHVCLNSPYGELIKHYSAEIIDLGFDGIWFDGCYQATSHERPDGRLPWSCCCDYCGELFKRQTGLDIPQVTDYSSQAFRRYVRWRNEWWLDYWDSLVQHVRRHNENAVLAFNYHRRFHWGTACGIGLRRKPMRAIIASELDRRPQKLLLEMRYMRAVSDELPPEMWTHGQDAAWPFVTTPHPEFDPAGMIYFGCACMTTGGFSSFGTDSVTDKLGTISAVKKALGPRAQFVGGQPVRHLGLLVSEQTLDFGREDLTKPTWGGWHASGSLAVWQSVHGMQYILDALHQPIEVLLDNQLEDLAELAKHNAIVMSDAQCVSAKAADAIEQYVRGGGVLLATARTATKDELGWPLEKGRLDALAGIESRSTRYGPCILSDLEPKLRGEDLPQSFLVAGPAMLMHAPSARQLAAGTVYPPQDAADEPQEGNPQARSAIIERKVGKGWVIFLACDVGRVYAQMPSLRARTLLDRLLARRVRPPYTVDAPPNVVVTAWRQGADVVFHVFNQHPAMTEMLGDDNLHLYWPEDVAPTGPVTIVFPGQCEAADCPTGGKIRSRATRRGVKVTLGRLEQHEIIRLKNLT